MTKREYKKLEKLMDKTIKLAYKLSANTACSKTNCIWRRIF